MARVAAEVRQRLDFGAAVAAAGLATGLLVGVALAVAVPLGLALLASLLYLPLVFVNLPLAVCLWIPLVFLEGVPALNLAGKAAGLVLVMGWAGAVVTRALGQQVLSRHRRLLEVFAVLIVWLTLSLAWAPNLAQAVTAAWQWWAVALVFVIVATSVTSERFLVLASAMYVFGAVLSVAAGVVTDGLTVPDEDGRLAGPVGDPNFLAAALISAVPIAFALSVIRSGALWRLACWGAVGALVLGVVTTQSRGGLVAAVGMWVAALVILPRRRQVMLIGAAALGAVAIAFAMNPGAWERVTTPDTGGTGRVDIWTVAWSVFEDHPVAGVGVGNFGRVAPHYVREVGPLEDVDLVVKTPDRAVHNSYLQFLAENGVVALVLFLALAAGCLRAALQAARTFDELDRGDLAAVTQALVVGGIGLLASYFFISGSIDRRLWILLGLSLAALEVANRLAADRIAVIRLRPPALPTSASGSEGPWARP